MAGTRGGFLESDWIENYKTYGPGLIEKLGDMLGKLESGKVGLSDWINTNQSFPMEDTNKHKALDKYMADNPGAIKNFSLVFMPVHSLIRLKMERRGAGLVCGEPGWVARLDFYRITNCMTATIACREQKGFS
jgi:hypothetical protein